MREHALDPLTWLPGRQAFEQRLTRAVRGAAGLHAKLAVMVIDVDRMAAVNDLVGRDLGDWVLRQAAARVARVLGPGVSLARLQEDDFGAFATVQDLAAAAKLAEAVLHASRAPYVLGCVSVIATASVGIALCPVHATEARMLLQCAADALRSAKALGSNRSFPSATCSGGTDRPLRRARE